MRWIWWALVLLAVCSSTTRATDADPAALERRIENIKRLVAAWTSNEALRDQGMSVLNGGFESSGLTERDAATLLLVGEDGIYQKVVQELAQSRLRSPALARASEDERRAAVRQTASRAALLLTHHELVQRTKWLQFVLFVSSSLQTLLHGSLDRLVAARQSPALMIDFYEHFAGVRRLAKESLYKLQTAYNEALHLPLWGLSTITTKAEDATKAEKADDVAPLSRSVPSKLVSQLSHLVEFNRFSSSAAMFDAIDAYCVDAERAGGYPGWDPDNMANAENDGERDAAATSGYTGVLRTMSRISGGMNQWYRETRHRLTGRTNRYRTFVHKFASMARQVANMYELTIALGAMAAEFFPPDRRDLADEYETPSWDEVRRLSGPDYRFELNAFVAFDLLTTLEHRLLFHGDMEPVVRVRFSKSLKAVEGDSPTGEESSDVNHVGAVRGAVSSVDGASGYGSSGPAGRKLPDGEGDEPSRLLSLVPKTDVLQRVCLAQYMDLQYISKRIPGGGSLNFLSLFQYAINGASSSVTLLLAGLRDESAAAAPRFSAGRGIPRPHTAHDARSAHTSAPRRRGGTRLRLTRSLNTNGWSSTGETEGRRASAAARTAAGADSELSLITDVAHDLVREKSSDSDGDDDEWSWPSDADDDFGAVAGHGPRDLADLTLLEVDSPADAHLAHGSAADGNVFADVGSVAAFERSGDTEGALEGLRRVASDIGPLPSYIEQAPDNSAESPPQSPAEAPAETPANPAPLARSSKSLRSQEKQRQRLVRNQAAQSRHAANRSKKSSHRSRNA